MLRTGLVCGDKGQIDVGGGDAGKLDLSLLSCFGQTLHSGLVGREVDAGLRLEVGDHPVDDALVKVVAAETVVTGSCENLLHAVAHLDDGNVEGAAAEVVYQNLLVVFFVNTVGKRCRGRLVDDSLNVQTGDPACVLGRLALRVGEVRRNGDDRLGNCLTEVSFGVSLQLGEDHGRDLLRGVALAVDGDLAGRTHVSLDGRDGSVGVGNCLTLCYLADHSFAVLGERNDGRGGSCAFCVSDNDGLAAFDNCYARVGGS